MSIYGKVVSNNLLSLEKKGCTCQQFFDNRHSLIVIVYRPGEVDPHIEPSRLFMVQRIKALRGQPYWVKDIIEKLKLETDVSAVVLSLSYNRLHKLVRRKTFLKYCLYKKQKLFNNRQFHSFIQQSWNELKIF